MNSTISPYSCPYCGNIHKTKCPLVCPLVKAITYNADGSQSIEFFAPEDYHVLIKESTHVTEKLREI